jgi:hypothetical protein
MDEKILLNYRCPAAIAGAERRTVVAIAVVLMGFACNFRFIDMFMQRSIDTWDCCERNDVNGQYKTEKPHPLILLQQI